MTKNKIIKLMSTEYVTLSGIAFHVFAGAFIWISSAYVFREVGSWLIPIAGMIVSLDHIAMIYKLSKSIDWKETITGRDVVKK